jgi:acyl carrier protein phosphodiesterase
MNYLAHLYLSGNNHQLMVGNFIGDAVKGNSYMHFPAEIRNGILLHRQIDSFTDQHENVKNAKAFFKKAYGRYSGVVIDILFDHFLAANWDVYHSQKLSHYVDDVNQVLLGQFHIMPKRMQLMMPFWVKHRWPELYLSKEGLLRVLTGMPYYTSMPRNVELF